MGKKKKAKNKSSFAKATDDEGKKKGLKKECCEKYIKKGEHKRCKRCPCFDLTETQRLQRFESFEIDFNFKN